MRVVSSANVRSLTEGWLEVQLLVYREKSRGESTQPCGAPVLMVRGSETSLPSLTRCFLSDRKSVIHLQVGSGTLSCVSLSWRRAGASYQSYGTMTEDKSSAKHCLG